MFVMIVTLWGPHSKKQIGFKNGETRFHCGPYIQYEIITTPRWSKRGVVQSKQPSSSRKHPIWLMWYIDMCVCVFGLYILCSPCQGSSKTCFPPIYVCLMRIYRGAFVWSINVSWGKSNTTFNTINARNSNIPLDERFGLHVVYDTHHWLFEVDLILLDKGDLQRDHNPHEVVHCITNQCEYFVLALCT